MSNFNTWKDNLNHHKSEVNPQVWESIAASMIKKRRRKIFLIFLGLGTILLSGSAYFLNTKHMHDTDKSESIDVIVVQSDTNDKASDITPIGSINEKIVGDSALDHSVHTSLIWTTSSYDNLGADSKRTNPEQDPDMIKNGTGQMVDKPEPELTNFGDQKFNPRLKSSVVDLLQITHHIYPTANSQNTFDRCRLPDPPLGCPGFGKKSRLGAGFSRWAVDLTYGPGYALRSMIPKSSESTGYAVLREQHEMVVYDQTIQARISYISKWGVAARAGINYGHTVEKFSLIRDSVTRSTTTITIDTFFNPDGSFTITTDTMNIPTPGRLEKIKYNHHRTLQIPIILAYETRLGDWTFHLNGGVMMNFLLDRKGEILNPSNQVSDISTNGGTYDAFNDQWGMLLTASVGANYRLTDQLHATIEPTLRHTLKSITSSSYPLDQKYTMINLNIGLRYEF